jgi:hypothetical protein
MGYRSDVLLGIAFPNTDAMIAFASAQRVTGDEHTANAIKRYGVTHMSADWGEGVVMWTYFEYVKWYTDYPEIKAHELILEAAREAEYSTIFTEVGEEYADVKYEVEHRDKSDGGMLYDCFNLVREIDRPKISKPLFGETE